MAEWCLCARQLTWSREYAVTSLVARTGVSPFGKLLLEYTPSRARGPLVPILYPFPFFVEAAMTPRRQKNLRQLPSPEPLRLTHRHAAGIDIHSNVHWVAVPPEDAPPPPANHPANLPKQW